MKPRVYIDGKEGTTDLQIYERLSARSDIDLLLIDEAKRKDPAERKRLINAAELVFLCLPDKAAEETVELAEDPATKIIDASTAHRTAPRLGIRPSGAGHRTEKCHRPRRAGGESRMPRNWIFIHCRTAGQAGHSACGLSGDGLLPHRVLRRREEDDRPVRGRRPGRGS